MSWFIWALAVVFSGASYQLLAKSIAGSMPVYFITAVLGVVMFVGSCIMLGFQSSPVSEIRLNSKSWMLLLAMCIAGFCIDVAINHMYRAGAPISLARMVTAGGTGLLLVTAGVLLFSEKLSPYQLGGIAVTIIGLTMLSMKNG